MTFPQYPQYPAQVPVQPYPAPSQFPVQQYPAPSPQPPAQPLAKGGLDDFFNQPSGGGGPAISWKDKPDGYTVAGLVARKITSGDVQQETGAPGSPNAGQPLFYRDGRPKFVMVVPLKVQPSQEFPEGEARVFVRGQLRDELVRAMSEAGGPAGAPEEGAGIVVTLTGRRQGRGTIPMNVFAVRYQRPQGAPAAPTRPVEQATQVQTAPQPSPAAAQPAAPAPAPQVAPQPGQVAPQPPSDLSPEQQQLLTQLTNQG